MDKLSLRHVTFSVVMVDDIMMKTSTFLVYHVLCFVVILVTSLSRWFISFSVIKIYCPVSHNIFRSAMSPYSPPAPMMLPDALDEPSLMEPDMNPPADMLLDDVLPPDVDVVCVTW